MKKLSILGLGALAIMSACDSKPTTEYTIAGTTDLADGEMLRIEFPLSNDSVYNDSCVLANGAFTFKGNIDVPRVVYLSSC